MNPRPWLSDRMAVLAAIGAAIGALHPHELALGGGAVVAGAALLGRRPVLVPVAIALLASGLGQRALDGLDGVHERLLVGEVTLVSDPAPAFGGVRADVRADGRRLEARAEGPAARLLADRLAGEVVRLRGQVTPAGDDAPWLRARHVSGRLTVLAVEGVRPGHVVTRGVNGLRRTLVAGTSSLDARERSLFTGLVLGDDRHQPPDLADAFRGAGLTHLLAVSGQNVAFTLALAGPFLRRLRLWPRLVATLVVIGLFGVLTRFEPSVLRASAMAALAATVAMAGRPVGRLRVVGLAVTGLLLVDPLLVSSVGFQLSVGAAVAIVVAAPRVAEVLPGPAGLRDAVAVTLAAQIGVAPVLLATFGPIPVASLPANLLAVPVAGVVMVWGLTGGLLAGVLGAPAAPLLHVPTELALGWLDLVARRTSRASLGELGLVHVAVIAVGLTAIVLARAGGRVSRAGWTVASAAVAAAVVAAHGAVPVRSTLTTGVVRWHGEGAEVVVLAAAGRTGLGAEATLGALRRSGVGAIDVLVVADASVPEAVVRAIGTAHPSRMIVAHRSALLEAPAPTVARVPPGLTVVDVGDLEVRLLDAGDRLVVEAAARGP